MRRRALQQQLSSSSSSNSDAVPQREQEQHLDALAYVQLRPTWLSQTSQAITTLNDIERVQIVATAAKDAAAIRAEADNERTGRVFWVETYQHAVNANSNIPTVQASRSATNQQQYTHTQQAPAMCIARSYDEFSHLRRKMYYIARDAHSGYMCAFCEQVVFETVGENPGRLMPLVLGSTRTARRLDRFVNTVLELAKDVSPSKGKRRCSGQDSIPLLLCEFLTDSVAPPEQHQESQDDSTSSRAA